MFKTLIYGGKAYSGFSISEDGRVKNLKTNCIYKQNVHKTGYQVVTLPMGKRGVVKLIKVHKALAETFIPNPNNYAVVNHIDENKLNNALSNLEWVTHKENTDKYRDNRVAENPFYNRRKLTANDVAFIRTAKERSCSELAKRFGVSKVTISNVKNRKLYNDVV